MPKNFDFSDMVKLVSSARLSSYRSPFSITDNAELFGLYSWNLELSGAFSSLLQLIEVALRNAINEAGKYCIVKAANKFWFEVVPFNFSDQFNESKHHYSVGQTIKPARVMSFEKGLLKARKNAHKILKKKLGVDTLAVPTLDQIISQTDFSVWEHILDKSFYDGDASKGFLWPKGFLVAFRKMPSVSGKNKQFHQRDILRRRVEAIRMMRNRVAHNEPIWKDTCLSDRKGVVQSLERKVADIVELAYWISPTLYSFIRDGALIHRLKMIICEYEINNSIYRNVSTKIQNLESLHQVLQDSQQHNRRVMISSEEFQAIVYAKNHRFS